MTERERKMIEGYIPSPRDKSLKDNEYYILDDAGRVQKVYISDIGIDNQFNDVYGVRFSFSGKRFLKFGELIGVHMYDLYDNKKDCKNSTHMCYNNWEHLRELEERERSVEETEQSIVRTAERRWIRSKSMIYRYDIDKTCMNYDGDEDCDKCAIHGFSCYCIGCPDYKDSFGRGKEDKEQEEHEV